MWISPACIKHPNGEKKFKIGVRVFVALVFKSNSDICNTCIYKFLKIVFIYIKESTWTWLQIN